MLEFTKRYARNYFASQNGEEGLLLEISKRLDLSESHCVEIGGSNGLFCSNTALLLKDHNWSGLFVEADYQLYLESKTNWADNPKVRSQCSRVDGKNINAFVDETCDLLSIDTDGSDYEIFEGLEAKPKILIVEIDSSLPPEEPCFNSDGGANYMAMTQLGLSKGYFLIGHTGNLILVDDSYRAKFPELTADPVKEYGAYFDRSWVREEAA